MVKTCCSDVQKGARNQEGDEKTITYASKQHGTGNWTTFSKRSGQRRSGKSNRERWSCSNQKPNPKHKSFTSEEEELVIQLHAAIGSRWPIIAQQLPGKTDNDVKILWNSKLRKKLSAMGIDPVTHKPFSQILADYGKIGAFPRARTRFSSLSRDLKNAIILKSEQSEKQHPQASSSHHFSSANAPVAKAELSDHHSLQLYSQLQAVNLVTEASNHSKAENTTQNFMTECASSSESPHSAEDQEISSFSWSDFFLEDAFLPSGVDVQENAGLTVQCGENAEGKTSFGAVEEDKNGGIVFGSSSFEASSSSNSSSFLEAMIGSQDEMFSQLPCFYEEQFYY